MSARRTVDWRLCHVTGKRAFETAEDAAKALGRAKSEHRRKGYTNGGAWTPARGTRMENRAYECDHCNGFHLTAMSRREVLEADLYRMFLDDGLRELANCADPLEMEMAA